MTKDEQKQAAAEAAVALVEDGMVLGMGTGSTAVLAIRALGARVHAGLRVTCVPTSRETQALLDQEQIPSRPLTDLGELLRPDLCIDGADEIDPALNLLKGRGGALLREKIVADASRRFVVIADEGKLVRHIGEKAPLPVEVLPDAAQYVSMRLRELFAEVISRGEYRTDNGNAVLDCVVSEPVADLKELERQVNNIPGVLEDGLFVGRADLAIIGTGQGVRYLEKGS